MRACGEFHPHIASCQAGIWAACLQGWNSSRSPSGPQQRRYYAAWMDRDEVGGVCAGGGREGRNPCRRVHVRGHRYVTVNRGQWTTRVRGRRTDPGTVPDRTSGHERIFKSVGGNANKKSLLVTCFTRFSSDVSIDGTARHNAVVPWTGGEQSDVAASRWGAWGMMGHRPRQPFAVASKSGASCKMLRS